MLLVEEEKGEVEAETRCSGNIMLNLPRSDS